MIEAHITDPQGAYLRTVQVDPLGIQPPGAVYAELPDEQEGFTRVYRDGGWSQVPDSEVPPTPAQPDPVPSSCTRRQGRLALLQIGLLDDVEAAIAAIDDPTEHRAAQIEYDADTWERGNAFLQQMWTQMGGTPETLDDLFRVAVTL